MTVNVNAGGGNDVINLGLSGGTETMTIGGNVDAGAGDDVINLEGDVIMPTGYIDGSPDTDTLNYNGGRVLDRGNWRKRQNCL